MNQTRLVNWILKHPFLVYITSGLFITSTASTVFVILLIKLETSLTLIIILTFLLLLPIHDLAETITCKGIRIFFKPHLLPEMDFAEGIPDKFRTLIVYVTLIVSKRSVAKTLERMEKTHIVNKDDNLPIAILTHFKDSIQEDPTEEESNLLDYVAKSLESLNKRYGKEQFFLFHRDRKWNSVSQKWVGWERKRGGVENLNKWLLGKIEGERYREYGRGKTFSLIIGDISSLGQINKVILLDSDNELPPGTAVRLVAKAAHPLNKPVISETDKIVVKGFGVLQPFPIPSKESAKRSFYSKIEGWNRRPNGPHHFILQALQDLFREGTYIGKGIYDVETHEMVLSNRFPDNQLLSHDKVESGFLRAAFLPDLLILEEALDNYLAGMQQIERWIRGDKQAIPWALPKIPNRKREMTRNPISLFSRWNLIWPIKKQLSLVFLILFCSIGWFIPELSPRLFSLILVSAITFPYLVVPLNLRRPFFSLIGISQGIISSVLYLAFSLHRALFILTAIMHTSFQLPKRKNINELSKNLNATKGVGIIRKHLKKLQILVSSMIRRPTIDWITSSEVKRQKKIYSFWGICTTMLPSLIICVVLGLSCFILVEELIYILPILGLWFLAPLIAFATSR